VPAQPPDRDRGDTVPEDVRRFLNRRVRSVAELEVLLFLRCRRERGWTATDLAAELGVDEGAAGRLMFDLMARRLLRLSRYAPPTYEYGPGPPELVRTLDRLAALHAAHPQALLSLVAAPDDRIVRLFADAFRIREDD
jgi:hypothetical protein